jgi:hypothetical protein
MCEKHNLTHMFSIEKVAKFCLFEMSEEKYSLVMTPFLSCLDLKSSIRSVSTGEYFHLHTKQNDLIKNLRTILE